jgi:hypothetical protein
MTHGSLDPIPKYPDTHAGLPPPARLETVGRAWRRVFETVWRVGAKELGADNCTDYGVHLRCQWVRIGIEAETHEGVSRPTYSVEAKPKGNKNNIECLMRLKGKSYGIHAVLWWSSRSRPTHRSANANYFDAQLLSRRLREYEIASP